ncbi:12333_t:CDS:2, partial [Acaulospora morrowiae]
LERKTLSCSNAIKSPNANSNASHLQKSYGAISHYNSDSEDSHYSDLSKQPFDPKMKGNSRDSEEEFLEDMSVASLTNDLEVKSDDQKIGSTFKIPSAAWTSIASYAILSFHAIFMEEVYTLYTVTAVQFGGLGFHATKLALSLTIMGGVQLISQFIIFPWITCRVNMLKLYHICWFTYVPVYLLFPLINKLEIYLSKNEVKWSEAIVWYSLLPVLTVRYFLGVCTFTPVMIFINNSTTSDTLGTVNGIGQTLASFVRSIGPAFGGFLWSWSLTNNRNFPFDNFFVFIVLSIAAFIGWIHSLSLPRDVNKSDNLDDDEVILLGE